MPFALSEAPELLAVLPIEEAIFSACFLNSYENYTASGIGRFMVRLSMSFKTVIHFHSWLVPGILD